MRFKSKITVISDDLKSLSIINEIVRNKMLTTFLIKRFDESGKTTLLKSFDNFENAFEYYSKLSQ